MSNKKNEYGKYVIIDESTVFNLGMRNIYQNDTPWNELPEHTDKLKMKRPRYLLIRILNHQHKVTLDNSMQILAKSLREVEQKLLDDLCLRE